jgi:type IV secretion system protein VirB10
MTEVPLQPPPATPEPPLDRTISPIAGRLSTGGRGKALAFAGLLVGCAAVAFGTWSADHRKPAKPREVPARQVVAFEPADPAPTLARPGHDAPQLTGADPYVPALEPAPAQNGPTATTRGGPSPAEVARKSPLMAYSRSGGLLRPASTEPALPFVPACAAAAGPVAELDRLRQGSTIGRATAHGVGDRNFLILAGATIPCVLQTAIDTTTAGYVTCLIDRDVYSDNGAVVLLEKGTRVLGEYRSGMRQGQNRIFVLWSRAVTPNGIAIALTSPASDALGRAGFDGAIDTHFWDRFGAALLLSVVGDASSALIERNDHSSTVRLPSDAAGLAVQQGADIAPTLRKPQGSEVAIQVAQDFDFSAVYGLKARP